MLGFRRLGWRVVFVDQLDESAGFDAGLAYLLTVARAFGFEESLALIRRGQRETIGMPRARLLQALRSSALLLNVMGYIDDDEVLAQAPRRVFLDIDPGFPQMWHELGLHDAFRGYDEFLTIGENIGEIGCQVPTCGLDWKTTTQPVVLERWPVCAGGDRFTSVGTWRGPFGPIDFRGVRYGLRVHEFRTFASLPRLTGARYELALEIDPSETMDLALLRDAGWTLVDPGVVAGDPRSYQRYIQASKAELMVAKNMYVETRSGWFSDRSACYLASGKPVLAQDTGFGGRYPTGEGLLSFSTLDEACAGVEEIVTNYSRHARAAREMACEYFDSDKVLGEMLARLGVG